MPLETVVRRWTIVSWLITGHGDAIDTLDQAIESQSADAVLLQSIRHPDAEQLAAGLGFNHAWALSHYPTSRLIPGSAVGLAVLTPHRIGDTLDVAIGDHQSKWSKHRRIGHTATVMRADHSSYAFGHAVAPVSVFMSRPGSAPPVRVHPARIDGDPAQAIELPEGAELVSVNTERPIDGAAQLLTVSFEMPWVQGDFPVP